MGAMETAVDLTQDADTTLILNEADRFARAFERAAGAPLTDNNSVKLLLDASGNFPAWLAAIEAAQRYILFESYFIADDRVGHEFIDALAGKARQGVRVCVVYDWLGSTKWSRPWAPLHAAAAEVRCFNPPSLESPLAWLTRDHRKSVVVDGEVAFVSGLCVSEKWEGDPARRLEPWRDTGVELRGDAVCDIERAFEQIWRACGGQPLPPFRRRRKRAGDTRVRVIAGVPSSAAVYRTDLLVASLAREHLWLTDAYFVGTSAYTQALRAAARDGVDVRLLVPGVSDLPAVSPLSRAGYRALLEAGVRVFEWNGTMLHAKTAVADRRWSRVGSTNLNLVSLISNYELDVAVEDVAFAEQMATQYEADLACATEIVLSSRNRVHKRTAPPTQVELDAVGRGAKRAMSGSAGRVAAGAVSVGSALGAALTNRRALGPTETNLLAWVAVIMVAIAVLAALFPHVVAWPLAVLFGWLGVAWGWKAWVLWRKGHGAGTPAEPMERSVNPSEPPTKAGIIDNSRP
ncbi:MAG: cardiolipin synthase B [Burkholderiales bacterium]|nr:cardiolipin synthase B [Burkholderiales bacterium]